MCDGQASSNSHSPVILSMYRDLQNEWKLECSAQHTDSSFKKKEDNVVFRTEPNLIGSHIHSLKWHGIKWAKIIDFEITCEICDSASTLKY